jgi:hypothetical protein
MARNILSHGASYGSLLATKLLMAGHNVTFFAGRNAELINRDGTEVRIKHVTRPCTGDLLARSARTLDAATPADVDLSRMICRSCPCRNRNTPTIQSGFTMIKIAEAKLPCLSIMTMPPLPYLKRIPALAEMDLEEAYAMPWYGNGSNRDWCRFLTRSAGLPSPEGRECPLMSACRPAQGKAAFADEKPTACSGLEADIDMMKLDGLDEPVKLKVLTRCSSLWQNGHAADRSIAASRCTSHRRSATPCTAI